MSESLGMDFLSELAIDAESIPSDEKLGRIKELVSQMGKLEKQIADLEDMTKTAKESLRQITDFKIPEAMAEAGTKVFVTDDGLKVEVKPFYSAKISEENRADCFDWLNVHGHSGLIKHQIVADLGKGEDSVAKQIAGYLSGMGISFTDKESIHHQTLQAFVREQIEKGNNFPIDLFNVFIGNTTKVKRV